MLATHASSDPRRPDTTRATWWQIAVCLLASMPPLVLGVGLGIPESQTLAPSSMYSNGGVGYAVPVAPAVLAPLFTAASDDLRHPRGSTARLTENARALGPAHTLHALIAGVGAGFYSHWQDSLLFSASDSTDPRSNGRRYELHLRSRLPFSVALVWVICFAAGARVPARRHGVTGWLVAPAAMAFVVACGGGAASVIAGPRVAASSTLWLAWGVALAGSLVLAHVGGRLLATRPIDLTPLERWRLAVAGRLDAVFGPLDRPGWRGGTTRIATLVVAALVFAGVLRGPWPPALLAAVHDDHRMLVMWGTPLLLIALWRRGWAGAAATVAITLVLTALPLAARWHDVGLHGNATGGLLPYSDARGYWVEANRLLDGVPLQWAARRPAFTALLSTVLAVTGRNLAWSLAILAALNGVAVALLGLELRRTFGPLVGAVGAVVLLVFYAFEGGLGTTLTENIGLAVAVLGFAGMVRGARESQTWTYAVGVGLVTFALMARAGAFFVLPATIAAAIWEFRAQWRRALVQTTAAIVVAATVALGGGKLVSAPAGDQQAFSNFSYSLYGLVVGGKGWQQVVKDHPTAREGAEIYALAWEAFKARPTGLIEGATRMWKVYLDVASSPFHAFVFIRSTEPQPALYQLWFLASGLGLVMALVTIARPFRATLVLGLLGHLASIPFVPPIDAGLRVYAATMPFVAAVAALGAAAPFMVLARLMGGRGVVPPAPFGRVEWPHAPLSLGLAAVVATSIVPLVLLRSGHVAPPPLVQCGAGQVALAVRVTPAAHLDIVAGKGPPLPAATAIREDAMRRSLEMIEVKGDVTLATAGQSLVAAYQIQTGTPVWMFAPTAAVPGAGVYSTCGWPSPDLQSRTLGGHYGAVRWVPAASGQ